MNTTYTLYGGGVSRAIGVEIMLSELGLPYELKTINIKSQESKSPEFLAINPAGFIPALITPNGEVLHETAAIMLWLADAHGSEVFAPALDDPLRGCFLSWYFYFTSEVQPPMKRVFYPDRYVTESTTAERVFEKACEMSRERWSVLDRYLLENGPYHLGERFSVADIHLSFWAIYGIRTIRETLESFSGIKRMYDMVLERPITGGILAEFQETVRAKSSRPW